MVKNLPPGALAWCLFIRPRRVVMVIGYVWSEHGTVMIEVFDPLYIGLIRTFHPDYIIPFGGVVKSP